MNRREMFLVASVVSAWVGLTYGFSNVERLVYITYIMNNQTESKRFLIGFFVKSLSYLFVISSFFIIALVHQEISQGR